VGIPVRRATVIPPEGLAQAHDTLEAFAMPPATAGVYSHSMVPGGLLVISNTQRLTPRTSLTMRVAIFSSKS
jgi:hypothetical protein